MRSICRTLVCLLLVMTLSLGITSCSIYGQRLTPDPDYMTARIKALTGPRPGDSKEVFFYAAVVDIDAGDRVHTLICHFDGSAQLYFSTDSTPAVSKSADPDTAEMVRALLEGLSQRTDYIYWQAKTDLALPNADHHCVYAQGDNGIYRLSMVPEKIDKEPVREILALYMVLYESLLAQVATDGTAT